jgi:hypothetical protein
MVGGRKLEKKLKALRGSIKVFYQFCFHILGNSALNPSICELPIQGNMREKEYENIFEG